MEDCDPKIILPNLWFNDPQNKIENMEGFEPKFNLPSNWIDDSQIKCYKNMDTEDTFAYSEELCCFIDPPADQTQSKDDDLANIEIGNISSATKEPCDIDDKATRTEETTHEGQNIHPLRLYHGNGPRIHRKLSIEYGVANKRCEDCGKVGQLTCFSSSFRKWAFRRVTEEELSQTCSRCHLRGHTCVTCDIPISHLMGRGGKQGKILHCGVCGEVGHNRRSCFHAI